MQVQMSRLRGLWLALMVCCSPGVGLGQTGGQDVALSPTLAQNPILVALSRIAPEAAASAGVRVKEIGSRQQDTLKGGLTPTPREYAQIAQNQDFATAFARHPDETVRLLRQINRLLQRTETTAPGR